ncbi:MAG: hypothetical protein ACK5LO_11360, partial [Leucobacter sp.]
MIMIDLTTLGAAAMMLTAIVTIGAFVLGSHRSLSKQFDTKIDALDTKFEAKFQLVDARFDGINKRLDGMDTRFDGIDARLDRHETKIDALTNRLDALTDRLTDHEKSTARSFEELRIANARLGERFDLWETKLLPIIMSL